jgi:hypothetical protein
MTLVLLAPLAAGEHEELYTRMKPASSPTYTPYTRHWDKRVAAAYLRMMGLTQGDAANAVGRSKRSVAEWEADKTTWALAREEARQRWLGDVTDAARVSLLKNLKEANSGMLALQVLERLDADLAPAKQRLDMNLEGGGLSSLLAAARTNGHG